MQNVPKTEFKQKIKLNLTQIVINVLKVYRKYVNEMLMIP